MNTITIKEYEKNSFTIESNGETYLPDTFSSFQERYKKKLRVATQVLLIGSGSTDVIQGLLSTPTIKRIFVIEPNPVFFICKMNMGEYTDNERITYISRQNIQDYYANKDLRDFLTTRPSIMWDRHAGENHNQFIKKLLSYETDNSVRKEDTYYLLKEMRSELQQIIATYDGEELTLEKISKISSSRKARSLLNTLYSLR